MRTRGGVAERRLEPGAGSRREGCRVHHVEEVPLGVGLLHREEPVVEPDLGGDRPAAVDPVDGPHPAARSALPGGGVEGAADLLHLAAGATDHLVAADHVGACQPHLPPGREPLPVGGRVGGEVVPLDEQVAPEGDLPRPPAARLGRPPREVEILVRPGPVHEREPNRVEHAERPGRAPLEVAPDAELELADVHHAVVLGHPDEVCEVAQRLGGDPAPAHAGDGGHAGVVPAGDPLLVDNLEELALRHHRVAERQPGELVLPGARVPGAGVVEHPVVEFAVRLELQRADGVGDPLDGVLERVGPVVHGVDAPGVAGAVVAGVADAVEERVPHEHVGVRHVDPRPQDRGAVGELPLSHAPEEVEVLGGRPIAVGARHPRPLEASPLLPDGLLGLGVHVGLPLHHQPLGAFVHLPEVVGGEVEVLAPVAAQPADVVLDRLDVLGVLRGGVGVVEAEVGAPPVAGSQAEVEQDRLGVADVQEAVGLGREAGDDLTANPARGKVGIDDVGQEVGGLGRFCHPGRVPQPRTARNCAEGGYPWPPWRSSSTGRVPSTGSWSPCWRCPGR